MRLCLFSCRLFEKTFETIHRKKSHTNATNVTMSLLMLVFFQFTSRLVDRFMPNKCNDCDYASCRAADFKTHLKMHIAEKSNNCSQCKFASSHERTLRKPLRTHSREKSNKCNQCDFASYQAGNLRTHLKHRKNCECCPLALLNEGSL